MNGPLVHTLHRFWELEKLCYKKFTYFETVSGHQMLAETMLAENMLTETMIAETT